MPVSNRLSAILGVKSEACLAIRQGRMTVSGSIEKAGFLILQHVATGLHIASFHDSEDEAKKRAEELATQGGLEVFMLSGVRFTTPEIEKRRANSGVGVP